MAAGDAVFVTLQPDPSGQFAACLPIFTGMTPGKEPAGHSWQKATGPLPDMRIATAFRPVHPSSWGSNAAWLSSHQILGILHPSRH